MFVEILVLYKVAVLVFGAAFVSLVCKFKMNFIVRAGILLVCSVSLAALLPQILIWFILAVVASTNVCKRNMKVVVCFAAVMAIYVESCYLVVHKLVEILDSFLSKILCIDLHVGVTSALVLVLFGCLLFASSKLAIINLSDLRIVSSRVSNIYFFVTAFVLLVLFKCFLINSERYTNDYEQVWSIVLTLILLYMGSYIMMQKLSRYRAVDYNYTFEHVVSNSIYSSDCCLELGFSDKALPYEHDKAYFTHKLGQYGLDYCILGYSQLVLCLIALKNSDYSDDSEIDKIVISCMEPYKNISKKPIFELLDDVVAKLRIKEQIDVDEFQSIDPSVKTGEDLVRFFLKVA